MKVSIHLKRMLMCPLSFFVQIQTQGRKRLLDGVVLDHLLATIAMSAAPPGQDEEVAAMGITESEYQQCPFIRSRGIFPASK